jgi:hypothetical protein
VSDVNSAAHWKADKLVNSIGQIRENTKVNGEVNAVSIKKAACKDIFLAG